MLFNRFAKQHNAFLLRSIKHGIGEIRVALTEAEVGEPGPHSARFSHRAWKGSLKPSLEYKPLEYSNMD